MHNQPERQYICMYKIFTITCGRWQLECQTDNKSIARQTVKTLRIGGKYVRVEKNDKPVLWRFPDALRNR